MSIRKVVGLLAGFALAVGLIGAGVGANFTSSVTAQENIKVGTFQCLIVDASPGATIYGGGTSVGYTASDIESSLAGSAPFWFEVKNTGSITAVASGSVTTPPAAPFTSLPIVPAAPGVLISGATQTYNAGLSWPVLDNSELGLTYSVVYTVNCTDAVVTVTSPAMNFGPNGWAGWSCPTGDTVISAAVSGASYTSLTLWVPGATAGSPLVTYPATPFGYTYASGEEGAIVQSTNAGGTDTIVLQCQAV